MSKGNACENSLLLLLYNNIDFANIGDAAGVLGSTVAGNLYVSLHTADPGEGGDQTTNECTYTSYARVAIARSAVGWTVTDNSVSPAANIDFPECTGGGPETVTHFAVGIADSPAAGLILHSGTVTPNIVVDVGVTPRLTTASTITED